MEFPETGKHCSVKDCKLLDFLPINCQHCKAVFCKEHFHMTSHECLKIEDVQPSLKKSESYLCSKKFCKEMSPVSMPCSKCKLHFCITHRHHGCWVFGVDETEVTQKLKKWQLPKKQFADAKAVVDQQVAESLKKSKNTALANKVLLLLFINKKFLKIYFIVRLIAETDVCILFSVHLGATYAYQRFCYWPQKCTDERQMLFSSAFASHS